MTQSETSLPALETSPEVSRSAGRFAWVQALCIGLLLVYVFWPSLRAVAERWNHDANWSHGWLVPLFSLYFLYARRAEIARTPVRVQYWGLVLLLASLAGYFYFLVVLPYGYLQLMCFVGAVFSATLFLTGWSMMRVVWLPILFLCFANPIPDQYYVQMTMPLQKLSTQLSAIPLSLIPGIELDLQAVKIDYLFRGRQGSLNVEEACAGMRLMMAFVTLGVAMAYMGDRPTWQRLCMVVACVPIAVFCNLVRVTATGFLTIYGHADLAQGVAHQVLGLVMLPIAFGLFGLTGYVLKHLFIETEDDAEAARA